MGLAIRVLLPGGGCRGGEGRVSFQLALFQQVPALEGIRQRPGAGGPEVALQEGRGLVLKPRKAKSFCWPARETLRIWPRNLLWGTGLTSSEQGILRFSASLTKGIAATKGLHPLVLQWMWNSFWRPLPALLLKLTHCFLPRPSRRPSRHGKWLPPGLHCRTTWLRIVY